MAASRGCRIRLGGAHPLAFGSLLGNVCVQGARFFCLGGTVAVRLFKRLRQDATVEAARRALDRVLRDEVRIPPPAPVCPALPPQPLGAGGEGGFGGEPGVSFAGAPDSSAGQGGAP